MDGAGIEISERGINNNLYRSDLDKSLDLKKFLNRNYSWFPSAFEILLSLSKKILFLLSKL